MKKYLNLFWTFMKIGLFTFGGGYAMISLIHKEAVEKNKWISEEEMNNIIVVAESTPGPISINASTFIGYKTGKILGAITATLALVIPSFTIIILISLFLTMFQNSSIITYAFQGIRAAIIILLFEAVLKLSKPLKKNAFFYSLFLISFILNFFFNINAIVLIITSIILAIIKEIITKKVTKNA